MDLRSQLRFYKYYHHNTTNVRIHSIFIPIILYSSLSILSDIKIFQVKTNIWVSLIYSCFYIYLCIPTGIIFVIVFTFMNNLISRGVLTGNKAKFGLFTLGWGCQFIGHFMFEGDKPAVFENLFQSLILAPYFILFELLFQLGLYKELFKQLEADITLMKKTKRKELGKPQLYNIINN